MVHKSRKEALAAGDKEYFTGRPCRRGNIDFRYASTGSCLCDECRDIRREACKSHYSRNKEYFRAKHEAYYAKHGDRIKSSKSKRDSSRRSELNAAAKVYYWMNREKRKKAAIDYIHKNYEAHKARTSARRAQSRLATPKWADKDKIKDFYRGASLLNCWDGPRAQVDHIVPLVSDLVCGLHCEQNLQILFAHENLSKGNRWWPDMPGDDNGSL